MKVRLSQETLEVDTAIEQDFRIRRFSLKYTQWSGCECARQLRRAAESFEASESLCNTAEITKRTDCSCRCRMRQSPVCTAVMLCVVAILLWFPNLGNIVATIRSSDRESYRSVSH